jgi:Pvc16 N-terminal domain
MSTPLAIATVTAVLQNFLQNSVTDLAAVLGGNVTVSTEPPDRIDIGAASPDRINLFLFQATENQGWRNLGLPTRSANGDRISNPSLALDLSYLLTAYGSGPLHAEALLGQAMFVLHEMPVFTRDAIRAVALSPPQPPLLAGLTSSQLADQIEQIKIVPQVMSVEELSKIWSALQSQYRPTAVYKASVVLIESRKSIRPTLPVRARNLAVVPFAQPVIDRLQSQAADGDPIVADQAILAGFNLVIDGQRLRGETTRVLIDEEEIIPADDHLGQTRIIVPLPPTLRPGLHSVQVAHPVDFGTGFPSEPHRGVESNVVAFVLAPRITTAAPIAAPRNTTLTLTISPPVGRAQRAALLAGGGTVSIPARPAAGPATTPTLDFPIPADFVTGTQLLRVQIDGAESPLGVDGSGQFASPTVTIT